MPKPTATSAPRATKSTAVPQLGASWLDNTVVLSMYGRAFDVAPVLGRLGFYKGFEAMASDVSTWQSRMRPYTGGRQIRPAVHLIYAMATPCGSSADDCLSYLDDTGVDIVQEYIRPSQRRGWLVVLDTQLGRSDPVTEVRRMISKGYLRYDNVQVALDPEFHLVPGHSTPGIPIGSMDAAQVNSAARLVGDYVRTNRLRHRKVLMLHTFNYTMLEHEQDIDGAPGVDLVVDMDGIGSPHLKVTNYNLLTNSRQFEFIRYRGLKLFPPSPVEEEHIDRPLLTFAQVFGQAAVGPHLRIHVPPDIIILA
ncbi:MAG: hypothetical protein M3281_02180 [Chloroflexota bacterium]|nr:hypothetical protein [Chloroflexota bacterium]